MFFWHNAKEGGVINHNSLQLFSEWFYPREIWRP